MRTTACWVRRYRAAPEAGRWAEERLEPRSVLNSQQTHSPEQEKVARLVDYLLRLATLRTKLIRDVADYERVLWVSTVPHERGCFTQAWGRDEEHEPD